MCQKIRLVKLLAILFLLVFSMQAFSQINNEGIPFITNYNARDYNANETNWSITQDHRGVMYFGNTDGILEYDGKNWNLIDMPGQQFVLSVATGDDGTIYAGGSNDFGHLVLDSIGNLKYESLAQLIDDTIIVARIWKIYPDNELIYFCSFVNIYIYNTIDKSVEVVDLPPDSFFSYFVDGRLLINSLDEGLLELIGDEYELLKGGKFFKDKDIFSILPWTNDVLLISVRLFGFYLYNIKTGEISDFSFNQEAEKTNKILVENSLYAGTKISDTLFAFGTYVDGLFVINKKGERVLHLNDAFGLKNKTVTNVFYSGDDSGILWISLISGISSINIKSPVRRFDTQQGIQGIINSIEKHKGYYFVGTSQGVFKKDYLPDGHAVFVNIEEFDGENVYSLQNITTPDGNETLIVGSTTQISAIRNNKIEVIIPGVETYRLIHSKVFPERLLVAHNRGLTSLIIRNNKIIIDENRVFDVGHAILNITEDKLGRIWCESMAGLFLFESDGAIVKIPNILKDKAGRFFSFRDDIFFISQDNHQVYKYDYVKHDFKLSPLFNELFFQKGKILRQVFPLNDEKVLTFFVKDNTFLSDILSLVDSNWVVDNQSLRIIPQVSLNTAYMDDSYILIGSSDGLFVVNKLKETDFNTSYRVLLRSVVLGADSIVFKGGEGFFEQKIDDTDYIYIFHSPIEYAHNNITFTYSSPYFDNEDNLVYSYYLEGFDRSWSAWTTEISRPFTNLREGNYRLHIKARNIYGVESQTTIIEFTILPPWFRTWWAYIIYVTLGFAIIAISISLYTRKLQQDKKRLEEIVRQRTAEILEKNKEIEQKNKSITDSIRYAKRIQTAVLPDKQTSEIFEYFIYFKPKDIVSGDFYWLRHFEDKNQLIVAAADCTGHGVPGAFMSMLGTAFLNEIVAKADFQHSDEILNTLREYVINALKQGLKEDEREEQKDGMDLGLVVIDLDKKELEFSGANNPMLFFRNGELAEYKPDKMPIGTYRRQDESFSRENIKLQNGDTFYLFSDGYVDQFGGEEGRKYMKKQFKEFLLSIHTKPISEQKQLLEDDMAEWSKFHEQLDDQIVIGMRANF